MNQGLLMGGDSLFVNNILPIYYKKSLQQAINDGDYEVPNNTLTAIKNYQMKFVMMFIHQILK